MNAITSLADELVRMPLKNPAVVKSHAERVLLLTSSHSMFGCRSGYRLADYLSEATIVTHPRVDHRGIAMRMLTRLLSAGAFTSWYRASSARTEIAALLQLIRQECRPVPYFVGRQRSWIPRLQTLPRRIGTCGTFHQCDDTLPSLLRYPSRVRKLHGYILMSETQAAFFRQNGVAADRIHVVHHGVDTRFFVPDRNKKPNIFGCLSWARIAGTLACFVICAMRFPFPRSLWSRS